MNSHNDNLVDGKKLNLTPISMDKCCNCDPGCPRGILLLAQNWVICKYVFSSQRLQLEAPSNRMKDTCVIVVLKNKKVWTCQLGSSRRGWSMHLSVHCLHHHACQCNAAGSQWREKRKHIFNMSSPTHFCQDARHALCNPITGQTIIWRDS